MDLDVKSKEVEMVRTEPDVKPKVITKPNMEPNKEHKQDVKPNIKFDRESNQDVKKPDTNNKKRSHTQLDSRKQVIAFQDRVMTINIKEAQHPLK